MEKREPGIAWREKMYFRSTNLYSKENLLYILWGSKYVVDKPYEVKRNYMDAYMLQYIMEGELHFEVREKHFIAKANELVLLDCREVNHYWATSRAKVKWFHFNGNIAKPLVEHIYASNPRGYFGELYAKRVEPYIDNIFEMLRRPTTSDFLFSHNIYSILCELASKTPRELSPTEDIVEKAVQYMKENYTDPINVKDVANAIGISLFYFTRTFKKVMYISPHTYLINLRLDNAKNLLTYTYYSIEKVARLSGFQSSSHFIRAFKQSTSYTPNKFRQYFVRK